MEGYRNKDWTTTFEVVRRSMCLDSNILVPTEVNQRFETGKTEGEQNV